MRRRRTREKAVRGARYRESGYEDQELQITHRGAVEVEGEMQRANNWQRSTSVDERVLARAPKRPVLFPSSAHSCLLALIGTLQSHSPHAQNVLLAITAELLCVSYSPLVAWLWVPQLFASGRLLVLLYLVYCQPA